MENNMATEHIIIEPDPTVLAFALADRYPPEPKQSQHKDFHIFACVEHKDWDLGRVPEVFIIYSGQFPLNHNEKRLKAAIKCAKDHHTGYEIVVKGDHGKQLGYLVVEAGETQKESIKSLSSKALKFANELVERNRVK